mmetsp:Transcript_13941/g.21098  ORF Transcript_13941/g.21098 Transcript_13941/m.21098 type:complete len:736 (+) Transcript_13941:127-2334(+)
MENSKPFSMKKFVQNTNQLLMTLQKLQEMIIKLGNHEKSTSRSFKKIGNVTSTFVEAVAAVEKESNENIQLLAEDSAKRRQSKENKKPELTIEIQKDDVNDVDEQEQQEDNSIANVVVSDLLNEVLHHSLLKMAQIHDHGYEHMAKKIASGLAQDREKITQSIRSLQQNYDKIKKDYSTMIMQHRKLKSKQEKSSILAQDLWIQYEQQTKLQATTPNAPQVMSTKQLDALSLKLEKAQADARKQTLAYKNIHAEVLLAHAQYVKERNAVMRAFIQFQSIIKSTIKSTLQSYALLKLQIMDTYMSQMQELHSTVDSFSVTAPLDMMHLSLTVKEIEPFEPIVPCYDKSEYEQRRVLVELSQKKEKKKTGFLGLFSNFNRPKSPHMEPKKTSSSPFAGLTTSRASTNPLDELLPPVPKSPLQMVDSSSFMMPTKTDDSSQKKKSPLSSTRPEEDPSSTNPTSSSTLSSTTPPSPPPLPKHDLQQQKTDITYAESIKIKDSKMLQFFQHFVDVVMSPELTPPTTSIDASIWNLSPSSPSTKDHSFDQSSLSSLIDSAREYLLLSEGRLAFAHALHIKRENRCLSPQAFQIFVDLIAAVLHKSHSNADPNVGRLLLNMCQTFYKKNEDDDDEYLLSHFCDHPLFQNVRFWESSFFDTLNVERKKFYRDAKSAQWASMNSAQRVDADVHHKNMVFGVLGSFVVTMKGVGVPADVIKEFLDKMCSINELSKEYITLLHHNV